MIDFPAISYPYLQFDGDFYHVLPAAKTMGKGMQTILQNYQLEELTVQEKQGVVIYLIIKRTQERNKLFLLDGQNRSFYFPKRSAFYYDPVIFIINSLRRLIDFNQHDR